MMGIPTAMRYQLLEFFRDNIVPIIMRMINHDKSIFAMVASISVLKFNRELK